MTYKEVFKHADKMPGSDSVFGHCVNAMAIALVAGDRSIVGRIADELSWDFADTRIRDAIKEAAEIAAKKVRKGR